MRTLGIDASGSRALLLQSGFGRFEILQTIDNLENLPPADRICIALSHIESSFRNLTVPTRDKKALLAAIQFELDDDVPLTTEDMIFDTITVRQSREGSAVHVALSVKKIIHDTIERYQKLGIDADIVTTRSWAMQTLLNRVLAHVGAGNMQESPVGILDINPQHASLSIHYRKTPVIVRTLDTVDAATLWKELQYASLMCKRVTTHSLSEILVTGSAAHAFMPELEQKSTIPCAYLAASEAIGQSEEKISSTIYAHALALALTAAEQQTIQFRRQQFAKQKIVQEKKYRAYSHLIFYALAIACSFALSLTVQSSVSSQKLSNTRLQVEQTISRIFPQIAPSVLRNYAKDEKLLKKQINTLQAQQRELAQIFGAAHEPALLFLHRLSANLRPEVVTNTMRFSFGSPNMPYMKGVLLRSVELGFYSQARDMDKKIADSLRYVIKPLTAGTPEAQGDGWKVTFTGKPKEASDD